MVQPAGHVVYAIHDYEIPGKGFLPLRAGDVLYVLDADASGWWLGVNLRRQKGVFPSTYTLPYVYPLPPDDLVRDARLLLLARDFGVDVASGSASPLVDLEVRPPAAGPSLPSADALRAELQRLLLDREDARRGVMNRLTELLDSRQRQRKAQSAAATAREVRARRSGAAERQLRQAQRELQDAVAALSGAKAALLLQHGRVPPLSWYERLADVVAANDAAAGAAPPCDEVWREAVRDMKGVVRHQETELAALSASAAAEEAAFTEAAAALQTRIEWRDANVAAMLAHWAELAARTKSAYISRKAEREAAEVALQQEAAQLRCRLEEGKVRFAATKEDYRRLKRQAQAISDTLKQQSTLDAISHEVAQLDRHIAASQTS